MSTWSEATSSTVWRSACIFFTGTFLYALMAIRTVDVVGGPGINVSAIVLAFAWLLASIYILVRLLPRIRGLAIGEVLIGLQRLARVAADRVYPVGLGPEE